MVAQIKIILGSCLKLAFDLGTVRFATISANQVQARQNSYKKNVPILKYTYYQLNFTPLGIIAKHIRL